MWNYVVSGSDEKVIRVFESPYNFVRDLNSISKTDLHYDESLSNAEIESKLQIKDGEV